MNSDIKTKLDEFPLKIKELKLEISKKIVGQDLIVDLLINSIFSNGHSLLIGLPGLAKTLLINTLAKTLGIKYSRIQFTPDLMPMDIIGSEILNKNKEFEFIKGPIFGNIILADEINRTPPKTQAALLEAMQEKFVTHSGRRYEIEQPFFVLATQNPIEQEGTYPLPEAQLDRFIFSIHLTYPSLQEEIDIVKKTTTNQNIDVNEVMSSNQILNFQNLISSLSVADNVYSFAVNLVNKTRPNLPNSSEFIKQYIEFGAGPRASQNLILSAKTNALMNGKYSPDIEDVIKVAPFVLNHRILLNFKAKAENISVFDIIKKLVNEK